MENGKKIRSFVAPKLQSDFYDSKNNYVTNATTHASECSANMCLGKIWLTYTMDSQHSVSVEGRRDSQYATGQGVPDFQ